MAVYKRNYKGYAGAITPKWSRFLILTRYSYARLFQSRFLVIFLIICFVPPIVGAAWIYLSHNLKFLSLMQIPETGVRAVGGWFFYYLGTVQSVLAFILYPGRAHFSGQRHLWIVSGVVSLTVRLSQS